MIQTDIMQQLYEAGIQLEKISETLHKVGRSKAGRMAKTLSEIVLEEHNQLQIPPAP